MKIDSTKYLAATILLIATSGISPGEPLVTDRPDATESSSVIAPGFMQLEVGVTAFEDAAGEAVQEYAGSLLRVGLVEDWELRLGWGGYAETDAVSVALGYGATDRLGFFIEVFGDLGLSAETSSTSLDGGVTWPFSDDSQLDLFAGVGLDDDADDWFVGIGYSLRFGY